VLLERFAISDQVKTFVVTRQFAGVHSQVASPTPSGPGVSTDPLSGLPPPLHSGKDSPATNSESLRGMSMAQEAKMLAQDHKTWQSLFF
jgi:hypothetical protein